MLVVIPAQAGGNPSDRNDDKVLELALNGSADYIIIITGDRDLLVLHPFRGILVITADEFLKAIEPE